MISADLVKHFVNAARALAAGKQDTGFTGNGFKKLDFVVKVPDESNPRKLTRKVFTALEQNPEKLSTPAIMARNGRKIIQIRDVDKGVLLGNVDVGENRFNSYDAVPTAVEIEDIENVLGDDAVEIGEAQVSAANSSGRPADNKSSRRVA